jgi:hypothetical protein
MDCFKNQGFWMRDLRRGFFIVTEFYDVFWMQILKFTGCAGVASESILVYAYILMECFKNHGFFSEDFENEGFEKGGWRAAFSVQES